MVRHEDRRSSLQLVVGICFSVFLFLTACSSSGLPETTPTLEAQASQSADQVEQQIPTNTAKVIPTNTEEGSSDVLGNLQGDEANSQLGYPAPEDPMPTSEDQTGGYPAPEDPGPTSEEQVAGYPAPSEEAPPPLKTELEATDPDTVSLASGELQLVEFFAFW